MGDINRFDRINDVSSHLKENESCKYCVRVVEVVDNGADEAVMFRLGQILKLCQQFSQFLICHVSAKCTNDRLGSKDF